MRRGSTSFALVLVASACGSGPGPGPRAPLGRASAPAAPVGLSPSEVSELGAVETVTADRPHLQDGARKAIADLSKPVASCLRDSLERDPTLVGQMAFTIQLGPHGAPTGLVTKAGSLASLPSATCVASVLGKVGLSTGDRGDVIRYAVELSGTYEAKAQTGPQPELERRTLAFDWGSTSDAVAPSAVKPIEALDAAVLRCLGGPGLILPTQPTWVALRVGDDGSVLLDAAGSSVNATEGEMCVRRKLEEARFPATRAAFVIEAMYTLHLPGEKASPTARPKGHNGFGGDRTKAPKGTPPLVRFGTTTVSGKLPSEVIQRIVRQSFGRLRLCYEDGLRKNPSLAGRVTVTFAIAADGRVSSVATTGDMPDSSVMSCVGRSFQFLSFPQPEGGGAVKVSYPLSFSPGEGAEASAPPEAAPAAMIGGKPLEKVDVPVLERALQKRGFVTRRLPGSDPTSPANEPVAVLFRDDAATFGVARVIDADKTDAECSVLHGGKALIVTRTGGSCDDVIARIVER